MKTRRRFLARCATLAIGAGGWLSLGCTINDPDALTAGEPVTLRDIQGRPVEVWLLSGGAISDQSTMVPSGSRASIVEDREVVPPKHPSLRLVRVRLEDGPMAGTETEVVRHRIARRPRENSRP